MAKNNDALSVLREFDSEPESVGYDLRLDLSTIVSQHLAEKGWTQTRLAKAAGMKPSFLTRIIHGTNNCTFEVAGRIIFALGIRAKLVETSTTETPTYTTPSVFYFQNWTTFYGKEKEQIEEAASTGNA